MYYMIIITIMRADKSLFLKYEEMNMIPIS